MTRLLLVSSLLLALVASSAAVRPSASQSLLEAESLESRRDTDAYGDDDGTADSDTQFPANFANSSLVEAEALAELEVERFEFPISTLCARKGHDWQYDIHDRFKHYFATRKSQEGDSISPYVYAPPSVRGQYFGQERDEMTECPVVELPVNSAHHDRPLSFGACCGTSRGMGSNYRCVKIEPSGLPNPPADDPYEVLRAKWLTVRGKSVSEILKKIQVPCPKYKVCDHPDQCPTNSVCCWSKRFGAPGLCHKGTECPITREQVFGRCDTKKDCDSHSEAKQCCFIHGRIIGRNVRPRRGFCSKSDTCGGKKTSFDCGVGNKCEMPDGNTKKCCQKLGVSMDFDPHRSCEDACTAVAAGKPATADITNKKRDHTALIPTLPLTPKKTDTTPFARSYNMMRFAQMATNVLDHTEDFDKFEGIQKKIELEEYCEASRTKMRKTARTAAIHIANSLLSVLSPYLLVELTYKNTAEKQETFSNTFVTLGDLTADDLTSLTNGFSLEQPAAAVTRAKKALHYLLDLKGVAPDPATPVVDAVYNFLKGFTVEPDAHTKNWFTSMTTNFHAVAEQVKSTCDRYLRLEYVDTTLPQGQQTTHLLKKVDYARFSDWILHPKHYDKYVTARITKEAKKARKAAAAEVARVKPLLEESFAKGKVCYSVWNKITFGLHMLGEILEAKNEKWNKRLGLVSEVTSIAGTLAASVSFGGSAVAAKGINFAIKQVQKNIEKQTKANNAMLETLLADFLAEPAKEYNKICSSFVIKANAAPNPRPYEALCPREELFAGIAAPAPGQAPDIPAPVATHFAKEKLPNFLRPLVNSHCIKALDALKAYKAAIETKEKAVKAAKTTFKPAAGANRWQQRLAEQQHVDADATVQAARILEGMALEELQKPLNKVVGAYRQCNFNNDLEAQFQVIEKIFKATLSMISCDSEASYMNEVREYFTEHVIAVTNEERDLYELYNNMLKEGGALKLLEVLVKVVGAIAEPLGARFMEMTFGHLAVFENAEQAIMQGLASRGIAMGVPVTQEQVALLQEQINELRGEGNSDTAATPEL